MTRRIILAVFFVTLLIPSAALATDPQVGIASNYGPGNGVAMHFCTWVYRHTHGCGQVRIQSVQTGKEVIVPVVDYCGCYVPNSAHPYRLVDLQFGVVAALGLKVSTGLYPVRLWTVEQDIGLPNTAMSDERNLQIFGFLLIAISILLLIDFLWRKRR